MNYNEFCNVVRDMVQLHLGDAAEVELQEVVKNNDVCFRGMIFKGAETNVSPTIYLESFFYAYNKGTSMEELVTTIVQRYRDVPESRELDLSFFKDFDRVKERIAYRLVNRSFNEKYLADAPFIPYLDLAICFFYAYSDAVLGEGTILIRNSHMKLWNTDVKELFSLAQENTHRLYPRELIKMEVMLAELMKQQGMEAEIIRRELDRAPFSMFVLTNEKRIHGAATILYPDLLEEIAGMLDCGFYIIPSSVHEVIIVPCLGEKDCAGIKEMIYDTNRNKVEPEEVLSDSLYAYDKNDKRIIKL